MIIQFVDNDNHGNPPYYLTSLRLDEFTDGGYGCNSSSSRSEALADRLDKLAVDVWLHRWYGYGLYDVNRWIVRILPDPTDEE